MEGFGDIKTFKYSERGLSSWHSISTNNYL